MSMTHKFNYNESGMKYMEKNLATLSYNNSNYLFLLLCLRILIVNVCSVLCILFHCMGSVYCLCVNVYCTIATGYQPNCS